MRAGLASTGREREIAVRFRRSEDTGVCSSRWRLAQRGLLTECGVPAEVADSDRRRIYLLLHGSDDFGTGWDASWITPKQANELLVILTRDLPNDLGCDLVKSLRLRAAE